MPNKNSYRDRSVINRLVKELEEKLGFVYSCENHLDKTGNLSKPQLNILYGMIQNLYNIDTYIKNTKNNDVGN